MYYKTIRTPLGLHLCGSDGENITYFTLPGDYEERECDLPVFKYLEKYFAQYFSDVAPDTRVPVKISGVSDFCRDVLDIVSGIPYGSVMTYGDIAKVLGAKRGYMIAAQAVGGAVKRNPVAIIIPCHRVVAKDGLGGYFGAEDIKKRLLLHEADVISAGRRRPTDGD